MQVVFVLFYLLVWGVPFNESFYTAFSARERVAIQGVAASGMPRERRPPALEPCPALPTHLPPPHLSPGFRPITPAVLLAFSFIFQSTISNI